MNYIAYHLKLPSEFEAVGEELYSQVFPEGFLAEDLSDGRILFSGYIEITDSLKINEDKRYDKFWLQLNSYLNKRNFNYTLKRELYKEKDWVDNWRENYQPVKVGADWIILPPWKIDQVKDNSSKKIIIDPGQAFGTGSHESTYLALSNLTDLVKGQLVESMLDIGTGSGVLAIAGRKLGIKKVIAIDISEDAIENCLKNFEYNRLAGEIVTLVADISQTELKKYELVISNLLAPIIHANFESIINKVAASGFIILSGYIDKQSRELKARLKDNDFDLIKEIERNEWASLIARRSDKNA
ncbi:MAG: 50S ribosomal protein L11 methyltransferase [Halarsenatibacteraceae bacterium]